MDVGLFVEFPCRDGMSEQEAFAECFTLVDEAEARGVASVWLAEYHFAPISVLSSPLMVASAIAARTRRIRIGLAVTLLPLYHPIHVAEDIATLDHISQGRVEFGVGRGTFPDTHDGFNSPFAESRERFDEYLEVILKAWTTERFSFSGTYYRCEDLYVRPKPVQTPHPPIRVGITSEVTFPLIGRMGYPIIINPSRVFALTELGPYIEQYRQAWQEAGHVGMPQVGLRIPLYVAETAVRAYSEPSYDDWLRDKVVYGTPDTVVPRLQQLRDELGLTQLLYEINYGRQLPYELQLRNLRLINEQVMPQFV